MTAFAGYEEKLHFQLNGVGKTETLLIKRFSTTTMKPKTFFTTSAVHTILHLAYYNCYYYSNSLLYHDPILTTATHSTPACRPEPNRVRRSSAPLIGGIPRAGRVAGHMLNGVIVFWISVLVLRYLLDLVVVYARALLSYPRFQRSPYLHAGTPTPLNLYTCMKHSPSSHHFPLPRRRKRAIVDRRQTQTKKAQFHCRMLILSNLKFSANRLYCSN